MQLLIDAGNSRVKWAVHDRSCWLAQGAVEHSDIATLPAFWERWPITAVWGASVARDEVASALEASTPCPLRWVRAASNFGDVRNTYLNPAEQGVDRWLAVLATRQLHQGDVIVACVGTALTVEALTAEGDYLGGLIVPGLNMMLGSLAHNISNLDRPAGVVTPFPQSTSDALSSGTVYALAGAVETQRRQLQAYTRRAPVQVLLTGGDAGCLVPWLADPVAIVDNLVLLGLLRVANEKCNGF